MPVTRNWTALWDAVLIILVLVAVKQFFLMYTVKFAGPISTVTAVIVATWRLEKSGLGWSDLGFVRPKGLWRTLALSVLAFAVIVLGSGLGGALADLFFTKAPPTDRFGNIEGDVPAFLMWLMLVWTHSAFFEEMLFRAFLIYQLAAFFGGSTRANLIAVVLAALFFGYRHAYYQGAYGFVATGIIGLGLGLFYLWVGRTNLLPQIIAHGAANTLSFTYRFLGLK